MLDPVEIGFRELGAADLALLHRWLNTDFVMMWWEKEPYTYEKVVEEYTPVIEGKEPTRAYLIMFGETPIGYIQTHKIDDYPEWSQGLQVGENVAGIDLLIGHPDYIHRGLGSAILQKFLREKVFAVMDVESCIIDPEPANKAAIRAYEKAGFKYEKTIQVPTESEPSYVMRIMRSDLE